MPPEPFSTAISGFVVSGSSSGRQLARPVGQRSAGVDVREHPLQLRRLLFQLQLAGLRLLRDALEPPLDVVTIGDQQLEPQRLEVVGGNARAREPVEHDEQRIHLAQIPE